MIKLTLIFLLLTSVVLITNAQSTNTSPERKLIGKVNLADSARYVLQLHVENEEYIYSIIDVENESRELKSFKLIFNDQTTFENNLKAAVNSLSKEIKDGVAKDAGKYFYAFNILRPAILEAEKGPVAMTLKFGQTATVRRIANGSKNFVKKKDIKKYLETNNLLSDIFVKEDNFDSLSFKEIKRKPELYLKKITFVDAKNNGKKSLLNYFTEAEISNILGDTINIPERYNKIYENYYIETINNLDRISEEKLTKPNFYKEALEIYQDYTRNSLKFLNDKIEIKLNSNREEIILLDTLISQNSKILDALTKKIENEESKIQQLLNNSNFVSESLRQNNDIINSDITILNREIETNEVSTEELVLEAKIRNINEKINILNSNIDNQNLLNLKFFVNIKDTLNVGDQPEDEYNPWLNSALIQTEDDLTNFSSELNYFNRNLNDSVVIGLNVNLKNYQNDYLLASKNSKKMEQQKLVLDSLTIKLNEFFYRNLYTAGIFDVKIDRAQLEFNNGFIENIVIIAAPTIFSQAAPRFFSKVQKQLRFTNNYPLGFSAKTDIERLKFVKLYAIMGIETEYSIDLREIITNVEELLVLNRRDYSPMNDAILVTPATSTEKILHKDKSTEILQAKVFSDLSGINGDKPNGLIQVEINKDIPLVTKRYSKSDIIPPFRWFIPKSNNVGYFNFIRPELVISKIESNQRSLQFSANDTALFASTLDIRQFEKVSVGADLNLLFMDFPYAKSLFYVNTGIRFGRTDLFIPDSLLTDVLKNNSKNFTNTFQIMPEFGFKVNGDERYGLDFNYSPSWVISDQRGFVQTSDTFKLIEDKSKFKNVQNDWLHRITMTAYFNFDPGTNGRFFFRFRSFHQMNKWSNNFTQYQVGYSTFITR
ncbi:hypothetical protein [Cyclobacterium plantarum]|uniref:hypothetical protein n=1 Tax=Cyclobacterium plantarum TaxID=2716263 RepID=UPI003F70B4B9